MGDRQPKFHESWDNLGPAPVTGEDAQAALAIGLAALESARTGRPVRLAELADAEDRDVQA